jgi:hypothetical protein
MTTRDYPLALFLHGDLADRRTLQSVLNLPNLPKMRKAWLPGYIGIGNNMVFKSGCGFGEWQEEEEVRGIAYFVKNDDEENILRDYTGAVHVRDADFQMCAGGILGKRDWVVGRVFTNVATSEYGENVSEETPERVGSLEEQNELAQNHPRVPREGFDEARRPLATPLSEDDIETQSQYGFKDALRLTENDAPRTSDEHISLLEAIRSTPPREQTHKADLHQVVDSCQETGDEAVLAEAPRKSGVMKGVQSIVNMFEKMKSEIHAPRGRARYGMRRANGTPISHCLDRTFCMWRNRTNQSDSLAGSFSSSISFLIPISTIYT